MSDLKVGLSLCPYTLRYDNGGGCVVFPFRAEYERDLIMQAFARSPAPPRKDIAHED